MYFVQNLERSAVPVIAQRTVGGAHATGAVWSARVVVPEGRTLEARPGLEFLIVRKNGVSVVGQSVQNAHKAAM